MDGARRTGRLTSRAGRPGAVVPIPAMTPMRGVVCAKPAKVAVAKDCRTLTAWLVRVATRPSVAIQ